MSRQELAEAVNAQVYPATGRVSAMDAHYVGRLERGIRGYPTADYRAAFRVVLGAALGSSPHAWPWSSCLLIIRCCAHSSTGSGVRDIKPGGGAVRLDGYTILWCGRGDLNPYARRHRLLRPARLPFRHSRVANRV